jgi:hypothetical protein
MSQMSTASRVYFASCAALVGYAIAYLMPAWAKLPRVIYDPVGRRWFWSATVGAVPLGYYGQIAYGVVGAIGAFTLGLVITRVMREPSERTYGLWAAWSLTALCVVGAWFTWNNWP